MFLMDQMWPHSQGELVRPSLMQPKRISWGPWDLQSLCLVRCCEDSGQVVGTHDSIKRNAIKWVQWRVSGKASKGPTRERELRPPNGLQEQGSSHYRTSQKLSCSFLLPSLTRTLSRSGKWAKSEETEWRVRKNHEPFQTFCLQRVRVR